jgi:hypothetical protein
VYRVVSKETGSSEWQGSGLSEKLLYFLKLLGGKTPLSYSAKRGKLTTLA